MKKRGSLNLSINAIVILILAITMLGLGLAFMRNIFGGATEEFEKVSGTVEKQMIDQMKESNKVVDISRPKIDLKIGDTDQLFLGFKNMGTEPVDFQIADYVPNELGDPLNSNCGEVQLKYVDSATTVAQGEVRVVPLNIVAASTVEPTTCFYEITIAEGATNHIIELTVDIVS